MLRQRSIAAVGAFLVVISILGAITAACSSKPSYPTKAIDFITAGQPGDANDVLIRVTAKYLSTELGVPVNVVNKPGGNRIPGVIAGLQGPADGYTMLSEQPATGPATSMMPDLPFKWDDRTFGPQMTTNGLVFVVSSKSSWNSLKDMAEAVKKDPGSFTWSSVGETSNTTILILQFLDSIGVEIPKTKMVPYSGSAPALTALAGGHVMMHAVGVNSTASMLAAGEIKLLAITGDERASIAPNVPTTTEAGFGSVNLTTYSAFSGPKAMPKEAMDILARAAKKVTETPGYQKEIEALGSEASYIAPDKMRDYMLKYADAYKTMMPKARATK